MEVTFASVESVSVTDMKTGSLTLADWSIIF
jgi:hypothetical protein